MKKNSFLLILFHCIIITNTINGALLSGKVPPVDNPIKLKKPPVKSSETSQGYNSKESPIIDTTQIKSYKKPSIQPKEETPVKISELELKKKGSILNQSEIFLHAQKKASGTYTEKMNSVLKTLIKKNLANTFKMRLRLISQITLSEILIECLEHFLLDLLGLSLNLRAPENNFLNNFKLQLQYIAEQISKYNKTKVYNDPEMMLLFMQSMHELLEENNVIYLSPEKHKKLNRILVVAEQCSNIFKNKNIIFTNTNTPADIATFFQKTIDDANDLENLSLTENLMHKIYDANGYIDQIMQTWIKFQQDDLFLDRVNRQFAAFLTFLLLFENTIAAAAIVINQTSALYKVTNPVPVVINIE